MYFDSIFAAPHFGSNQFGGETLCNYPGYVKLGGCQGFYRRLHHFCALAVAEELTGYGNAAVYRSPKFHFRNRLLQEVDRTCLHPLHNGADVTGSGNEDYRQMDVRVHQPFLDGQAVETRQFDIKKNASTLEPLRLFLQFSCGSTGQRLIAQRCNQIGQMCSQVRFIIHNQDGF